MAKVQNTASPGLDSWSNETLKTIEKTMTAENNRSSKKMRNLQLRNGSFFWRNRTKLAAKSISGEVDFEQNEYKSFIGHGKAVTYAFFLEIENEGKFSMLPSALKYLTYLTVKALSPKLQKLGFFSDFNIQPYEPTPNHRLAAQRPKK